MEMDVPTVAIAVGLVVSLIFSETFGLAAGGMIVPGYLAMNLDRPLWVLGTLLAAAVTFGLVRLISRWAIIYGRRRIVIAVIIGFCVGAVFRSSALMFFPTATETSEPLFNVIGFIIPGLIAVWMDRQGTVETLCPVVTSAVAVRLVLIAMGLEVLS
ncbi:MAG: poly-gamma-glutamate biosynthesis protein PgsC [Pirellulales bacterium]|nr:poly-gamma-glutamate biosynthesis protein PgsC [Pirellulales bacterium]